MVFDNSKFKNLRNLLGLTQHAFAESVGSSQQVVAMVENNKRAVPSSIKQGFYTGYGVSYERAIECKTKEELNILLNSQIITNNNNENNIVAIPIHDISAAAGAGTWLSDEPEVDKMFFDKRFLRQILKSDDYSHLHLIHAQGDSMDSGWNQPNDIKDGDLLLVDSSQTTGNNQIFVIRVNNSELRVKRLFKRGDVLYISSNNSKYKDEVYYPDNNNVIIEVIGRVVWNGSKENV